MCPKKLDTAQACFDAAKNVGIDASAHVTTEQGSSADLPSGCIGAAEAAVMMGRCCCWEVRWFRFLLLILLRCRGVLAG